MQTAEKLAKYEELQDKLDKQFEGRINIEMFVDSIIEFDKQFSRDKKLAEDMIITNDDVRKYREWKRLDEQGRLMKLPCTVGHTVWDIDFNLDRIVMYYKNSSGSITESFSISETGKTVFCSNEYLKVKTEDEAKKEMIRRLDKYFKDKINYYQELRDSLKKRVDDEIHS